MTLEYFDHLARLEDPRGWILTNHTTREFLKGLRDTNGMQYTFYCRFHFMEEYEY